jgi:hypothetical protein
MMHVLVAGALCAFLLANDSCGGNTGEKQQVSAQQRLSEQADAQVGLPGITNFTERKIVRKLYELRDQNIATFSYVTDLQGRLWHVCDSIGYGLPYGVQFTNPERPAYAYETHEAGNIALPQPEPNALFIPHTAEGTWIICASQKTKGDIEPMYVEPRVIVSPYKLNAAGDWQLK